MKLIAILQLLLLTALAFGALAGALASVVTPHALRATTGWSPERRHRALLLLSLSPGVLTVTVTAVVATLALSVLALAWPAYDPCVAHDDGHAHLCFAHLPANVGGFGSCLVVILALASIALIITPRGARAPFVRSPKCDRGPNEIGREGVQRRLVVSCNVANRGVGSVVADIRAAVARAVKLPSGYRVDYGGQFESAEGATRTILVVGSIAIAAMFGLLFVAFRSTRDAVLVMSNLPLALIGGVVGVYLEGGVLSVASLVGFITLFGIATPNGIMLVSHIRHLVHEEGMTDVDVAVRRGATERLVPILMTALAAGLGLVPLALAAGKPGSEIQAPMAIVIRCGLLSSIVLNMFVVPALYRRFGDVARRSPALEPAP